MREILYLQAGNYSNYVGTHFWNTQDLYRDPDLDGGNQVDDSISFTERQNSDGTTTLYPRVIIFDLRDNFGTLSQSNARSGTVDEQSSQTPHILWDRHVDTYQQSQIAKSAYHTHLDESSFDRVHMAETTKPEDIRYWSDFSDVYYLPRSIQRMSNPLAWDASEDHWAQSRDLFRRYNEVTDLMDTSVRLLLEESDSIQGVQLINDIPTFGGFCDVFLTQLKDEFTKTPTLVFPTSLTGVLRGMDFDDNQAIHQIVNEALYLRGLNEQATLSIPIGTPKNWPEDAWFGSHTKSVYFSSSIISSHVESATLFLRTKHEIQDSVSTLAAEICTATSNLPFCEIGGVFPVDEMTDLSHGMINFTVPSLERSHSPILYSARDVIRGFGPLHIEQYDRWMTQTHWQFKPRSITGFGFPMAGPLRAVLPSSSTSLHPGCIYILPDTLHTYQAQESTGILSRLSATSNLAHLFKSHASFVDTSLRRRSAGVMSMGIDTDDLRELANDLWTIHDRYPVNGDKSDLGEVGGSDDD